MSLTPQEALTFLNHLFPGGLKVPDLIEELGPVGWGNSPLFACYHPSAEVRYEENLAFPRNLKRLAFLGKLRMADTTVPPPDDQETSFEALLSADDYEEKNCSPQDAIEEPAELLGLCLWDVFSDNHEVIARDGRVVDLGSFRGSAGVIAEFFDRSPNAGYDTVEQSWGAWDGFDCMRFYMGTSFVSGRADLRPVYRLIFARLQSLGCRWHYSFPQIYVVRFPSPGKAEGYDPSQGFAAGQNLEKQLEEHKRLQDRLENGMAADKRQAWDEVPTEIVQAYQEVFGEDPSGWPPDLDSED
jgi:hypothetical protein